MRGTNSLNREELEYLVTKQVSPDNLPPHSATISYPLGPKAPIHNSYGANSFPSITPNCSIISVT